eukprot:1589658-Alexandrium_andersonii.AAC.1
MLISPICAFSRAVGCVPFSEGWAEWCKLESALVRAHAKADFRDKARGDTAQTLEERKEAIDSILQQRGAWATMSIKAAFVFDPRHVQLKQAKNTLGYDMRDAMDRAKPEAYACLLYTSPSPRD